jgi:hypothetical protein
MTDEQIAAVNGDVLHVPTVLGAVVATYNLPSLGPKVLRFDGPTLADIYLGRITKWNDARVASLNPGVALPAQDILVVHRSDGSGTTYIFTDFLSKVSPEWQTKVGHATSVEWPVGLGGKGNEGVTQQVKQSDGAIGMSAHCASRDLPPRSPNAGQFIRTHAGCRGRRRRGAEPRLSGIDHQCKAGGSVSDRLLHLAPGPPRTAHRRSGSA